jgi:hypothetical protein
MLDKCALAPNEKPVVLTSTGPAAGETPWFGFDTTVYAGEYFTASNYSYDFQLKRGPFVIALYNIDSGTSTNDFNPFEFVLYAGGTKDVKSGTIQFFTNDALAQGFPPHDNVYESFDPNTGIYRADQDEALYPKLNHINFWPTNGLSFYVLPTIQRGAMAVQFFNDGQNIRVRGEFDVFAADAPFGPGVSRVEYHGLFEGILVEQGIGTAQNPPHVTIEHFAYLPLVRAP